MPAYSKSQQMHKLGKVSKAETTYQSERVQKRDQENNEHQALKEFVRSRDNWICVLCGAGPTSEVHHIVALGSGGEWTAENMVTLCRTDHILAQEYKLPPEKVEQMRAWAGSKHGDSNIMSEAS